MSAATSHRAQILRYLEAGGSLSQGDAERLFFCRRLAARIWDLRHAGHPIGMRWVEYINQYGNWTRYGVYYMEGKHGHQQVPGVRDGGAAPGPLEV